MDFNLGKDQAKDIVPYTRAAIEKYIFNKLNEHLNAIYMHKHSKEDIKFQARQGHLNQKYQSLYDKFPLDYVNEIMAELDIKNKLRLIKLMEEESPINN